MKDSQLMERIVNKSSKLYCIVGPNTTGKSYFLNRLFENIDKKLIYIDEVGDVSVRDLRAGVKISGDYYIYENEKKRGKADNLIESEKISESSRKILVTLNEFEKKINVKHMSLGSKKLSHMLNSLRTYNLNSVEYILLDEPENSLDDENVKIVGKLITKLIDENKVVVMVTHSPRLLEVLKVSINNIYVLPKLFEEFINVEYSTIRKIMDTTYTYFSTKKFNYNISKLEMYDFGKSQCINSLYIDNILFSYEFYRTLFYKEIILVEGLSENILLQAISNEVSYSCNYFVANGKNFMYFLIKLFSEFHLSIKCYIDTDNIDRNLNFSSELTNELKLLENKDVKVINVPGDLEKFLEIDIDKDLSDILGIDDITRKEKKDAYKKYKKYLGIHKINSNKELYDKFVNLFIVSQQNNEYTF